MSYRSNLYALVHGSDLISFLATLKVMFLEGEFESLNEAKGNEILDENSYARFVAYCLTWFDGHDDVDAINELFNNSIYSCLLRIGEDSEDREFYTHNRSLEDRFDVTVKVTVNFD